MELFVASVAGTDLECEVRRASEPRAVALVVGAGDGGRRAGRVAADEMTALMHSQGATVISVDLSDHVRDAGDTLRLVDALLLWARAEEGMGLPVCLAAVGPAAPFVYEMAAGGAPDASVVSWNGQLRGARAAFPSIEAPSLLLVEGGPVRRMAQRVSARHLGGPSVVLPVRDADLEAIFGEWLASPRRFVERNQPRTLARVTPAAAAAVLAVSVGAGMLADAFDHGVAVAHTQFSSAPSAVHAADNPAKPDKVDQWAKAGAAVAIAGDGKTKAQGTGGKVLTDAQGLKYFVNTNITFNTTSSASGAMSEASFNAAVPATTLNGGTVQSTLNDAFDGYQGLFVDIAGGAVPTSAPSSDSPEYYNKLGAAPTDDPACSGRQLVFPTKTYTDGGGSVDVHRTVFVPANDQFGRWVEYLTNNGSSARTVTVGETHNLGSDSNTKIVATSSGGTSIGTSTQWVNSFQDYSGTTSSDPRLGHVMAGAGGAVGLGGIAFVDGDDNPIWGYTVDIPAGATVAIVNYVTGQPSNAAAQAKAAELAAGTNANQFACMTDAEKAEMANFAAPAPTPPPAPPAVVIPPPVLIQPKFTG